MAFFTRIQLKYDTWANWNTETAKAMVPLKGEVCLVEVPTGVQSGLQDTPPSVLMKVGNGVMGEDGVITGTAFGDLPWLSALAADVHAWAKLDATKFTNWLNGTHKLDGSVVSDENPTDCPITFATDADIAEINATLESHNKRLGDLEAALGIEGGEGTDSISDQVAALKTSLGEPVADDAGKVDGTAYERIAANKVAASDAQSAANAAQADATKALADAAKAQAAAEAADAKADTNLGTAKTYAESQAASALAEAKKYADETTLVAAKAYTDDKIEKADAAHEAITNAIDGKVNTLIGSDTGKSVRAIANDELTKQLIPDSAKESLDTLTEIAAWIQSHPEDAAAMNEKLLDVRKEVYGTEDGATADKSRIDLNAEAIASEASRAQGVEAGLQAAIDALNGKDGAQGTVDSKIATAIETAKGQWEDYADQAEADAIAAAATDAAKKVAAEESRAKGIEAGLQAAITTLQGEEGTAGSVKNTAKGYADQAKTDAISAAATDAQTKADAAQSAAVTAANAHTDAEIAKLVAADGTLGNRVTVLEKAVEDLAEDSVDTRINAAESRAATDAQTKANAAKEAAIAAAATDAQGKVDAEKARAEKAESDLQAAIDILNGEASVEGSVAKAKAEAIAAAATDAQTKADGALAAAKDYTDDEIEKVNSAHKAITDGLAARPFVAVESNTKTEYVIFNCGSATEVI